MKRLPDYESVHVLGKQRRANPQKKLWLRRVLEEYMQAYPGRVENDWILSGIIPSSSEDDIHKKRIQVSMDIYLRSNNLPFYSVLRIGLITIDLSFQTSLSQRRKRNILILPRANPLAVKLRSTPIGVFIWIDSVLLELLTLKSTARSVKPRVISPCRQVRTATNF